jgi:hypothetical protein
MFVGSLGYTARHSYDWHETSTDVGLKWFVGVGPLGTTKGKYTQYQILDGLPRYLDATGESPYATPYIHAWVCSAARCRLREIMECAGRGQTYYCDTDGILVSEEGRDNIRNMYGIYGSSVGDITQRFLPGPASVYGKKNYRIGDNVIAAGVVVMDLLREPKVRNIQYTGGEVLATGEVRPYNSTCEDTGEQCARWVNTFS